MLVQTQNYKREIVPSDEETTDAMNRMSLPLTLEIVENEESLSNLRDEWNDLVISSNASVYQTFEWLTLWWKHLGRNAHRQLRIILIKDDGRLVGIAPMFVESYKLIGIEIYRTLCMLGSGTAFRKSRGVFYDDGLSDFLDIIIKPGCESDVVSFLLSYLKQNSTTYDALEFVNAPEDGSLINWIVPAFKAHGFATRLSRADVCPRLAAPTSMEDYTRSLHASVRRRLSQAMKAAKNDELFHIAESNSSETIDQSLAHLVDLHQRRWNSLGYPGLFMKKEVSEFQRDIAQKFSKNGWLWFQTASTDGTCLAARLGFRFNGTLYDYLSGFDDEVPAAKHRPGLALLMLMIVEAVDSKFRWVDFLRGDEKYKFELTSTVRYNWNVEVYNPKTNGLRGRLFHLLRYVEFGKYLLSKEWTLLRVHYRTHGLLKFMLRYIMFRSERFRKKMSGAAENS